MESKVFVVQTLDLKKVYHDGTEVVALNGVSLTVAKGELLAVTGPSGSGKSTLLHVVGTLDVPTQGHVTVNGVDVETLKGGALADFRRENIGFVFQFFNLVPVLTALENVMLPLMPYRRRLSFSLERRAQEFLAAVELESRIQHLPSQLSGGEQQRVAMARALINEPKLVLADEPTGNVDSETGAGIIALLRRLAVERGVSVMLATHDASITLEADRVVRMRDGSIVK